MSKRNRRRPMREGKRWHIDGYGGRTFIVHRLGLIPGIVMMKHAKTLDCETRHDLIVQARNDLIDWLEENQSGTA